MKKLLPLLLLVLCTKPVGAAHVIVQSGGSAADTDNSAVTTAVDTTGATFLVMSCSWFSDFGTLTATASDSKSNTWTGLTTYNIGGSSTRLFYVNSATPTVGAGHTFTCDGNNTFPVVAFIAASGGVASPLDQQNGDADAPVTSIDHNGGISPTEGNTMVVASLVTYASGHSIDSGFTTVHSNNYSGSGQITHGGALAYLIQGGTASASNPSWSWVSAIEASSAIANFKSSSGGTFPCTLATTGAGRC
jgi:hypothetical protein